MKINNSVKMVSFKGNLQRSEKLKERITNDSALNVKKIHEALERMDKVDDNCVYSYVEENTIYGSRGADVDKVAYIIDEQGNECAHFVISSWKGKQKIYQAPNSFISKLICDFVDSNYSNCENKKDTLNSVFNLMV